MNHPAGLEALQSFLADAYGLDRVESVELISESCNTTYRVRADADQLLLRLYGPNEYIGIRPDAYRFELELLDHLSRRGVPVAAPIPLRGGQSIPQKRRQFLSRFESGSASCDAALFRFAPGRPHAAWWPEMDETVVPDVGAALARLHLEAESFRTNSPRHHFDLHFLLEEPLRLLQMQLGKRGRSADLDFFRPRADELRSAVSGLGKTEDVYGVIHGDAHVGNVLYDPTAGFTIIDFDLCAFGWRVYDLVPLLNTLIINVPSVARAVWQLLLDGYDTVRPLSGPEMDAIPAFSQLWHLWDIGETLVISSTFGGRVKSLNALSPDGVLDQSLETLRRLGETELSTEVLFRETTYGRQSGIA